MTNAMMIDADNTSEYGFTVEAPYLEHARRKAIAYLGSKWILYSQSPKKAVTASVLPTVRLRTNLANVAC